MSGHHDPFTEPPASAASDAPQEDGGAAAPASQPAHEPEGRADEDMGEFDPFVAAAERLASDARDGLVRNAKDQADYEALPDHLRAEVDAAGKGER